MCSFARSLVRSFVDVSMYCWLAFGGNHNEARSYDESWLAISPSSLVFLFWLLFVRSWICLAHACCILLVMMERHRLPAMQGPSLVWCIVAPDGARRSGLRRVDFRSGEGMLGIVWVASVVWCAHVGRRHEI